MAIRLTGKKVLLAAAFAAQQDFRFYLNGIKVEPHPDGGAILIATDGHRMVVVRDADAVADEEAILQVGDDALKALRKKTKEHRYIDVEGDRLRVMQRPILVPYDKALETGAGTEVYIQPGECRIDGRFPDWRRVIPKADSLKPGIRGGFNAKYLADACTLLAGFGMGVDFFTEETGDEFRDGPLVIRTTVAFPGGDFSIGTGDEMFAVVMPMRLDVGRPPIPEWVNAGR